MFDETGGGTNQLHSHGPVNEPKEAPPGRTTQNSMQAGLMDEKQLQKAKCQFEKNEQASSYPEAKKPSPKHKPELEVQVHGIPVQRPRKRDIKCPVWKKIYHLVKELNTLNRLILNLDTSANFAQRNFKIMQASTSMKKAWGTKPCLPRL